MVFNKGCFGPYSFQFIFDVVVSMVLAHHPGSNVKVFNCSTRSRDGEELKEDMEKLCLQALSTLTT